MVNSGKRSLSQKHKARYALAVGSIDPNQDLLFSRRADFPFVAVKSPRIIWKQRQLKPDLPPEPRLYPTLSDEDWKAAINNIINSEERAKCSQVRIINVSLLDNYIRHYFHFMESLYAIYCAKREIFPNAKIERIYIGDYDTWSMPKQGGGVQKKMLDLLFPEATVDAGKEIVEEGVENWLIVDRTKARTRHNKMVEPMELLVHKHTPELRKTVFEKLRITPATSPFQNGKLTRTPNILYSSRKGSKRDFAPDVEAKLLELLKRIGNVREINFADCLWEEQVRLSAAHDVMIGIHGNNLTNFMWLPPDSTCIEIFPKESRAYDYQMQAEFFGHFYGGIDGEKIYPAFSRTSFPYGEIHSGVDYFPRQQLLLLLRKYLQ